RRLREPLEVERPVGAFGDARAERGDRGHGQAEDLVLVAALRHHHRQDEEAVQIRDLPPQPDDVPLPHVANCTPPARAGRWRNPPGVRSARWVHDGPETGRFRGTQRADGGGWAMAAGNREQADVVIVGARVAGSPAATELARRGRKVIVLDAGTFPSDTLSTHVIFPSCVAELSALGALEPLLATGSPTHPNVLMNHGGIDVSWNYTPVDGFDYGMC